MPRFHRIVQSNPPGVGDFFSYRALGKNPPVDPELARRYDGISVYDSLRRARWRARSRPQLGRFIAELDVPDTGPLRFERTGEGVGHWTLWGPPEAISACIVSIVPVEAVHSR